MSNKTEFPLAVELLKANIKHNDMFSDKEKEAMQSELSRLEGGGWISVDERLPEEGQLVDIWVSAHAFEDVEMSRLTDIKFNIEQDVAWFGGWSTENVTHWRRVPDKPKTK